MDIYREVNDENEGEEHARVDRSFGALDALRELELEREALSLVTSQGKPTTEPLLAGKLPVRVTAGPDAEANASAQMRMQEVTAGLVEKITQLDAEIWQQGEKAAELPTTVKDETEYRMADKERKATRGRLVRLASDRSELVASHWKLTHLAEPAYVANIEDLIAEARQRVEKANQAVEVAKNASSDSEAEALKKAMDMYYEEWRELDKLKDRKTDLENASEQLSKGNVESLMKKA